FCHFLLPHWQARALEVCLLEQRVILVGHHVGLGLRHEVDGYHHDDQQRSATEIERHVPAHLHELGHQAHECDVDGSGQCQAHQNLVDVTRSLFTRTDSRNEGTAFLQIVCGLAAVEHEGRIEKAEENDQGR